MPSLKKLLSKKVSILKKKILGVHDRGAYLGGFRGHPPIFWKPIRSWFEKIIQKIGNLLPKKIW